MDSSCLITTFIPLIWGEQLWGGGCKRYCVGKTARKTQIFNHGNDRRQAHSYNGRLIGNGKQAFDWYQLRWPRMTLNGRNAPSYPICFIIQVKRPIGHVYYQRDKDVQSLYISATYRSCKNSQGEWPLTQISRDRHYSPFNISEMITRLKTET